MKTGKVYLVGAGPGDIGLSTLKSVELIKRADVVVYDQLANPELLSFARKKAEIIFAGKFSSNHILQQKEINSLLLRKARAGKMVVRLKGGDPLLFGRGAEEALVLAEEKIPFEIVPGVSSAYSVPAYAGIPVTYRNISSRLNIVTGHETPDKGEATIPWKKLFDKHATLVILMGFGNLEKIVSEIGTDPKTLKTPVALISNGTRWNQKVVVGEISSIVSKVKASGMKAPAIIVIGEVVRLREKLEWFVPQQPLSGKHILVTRPQHQASDLKSLLEARGAKVSAIPLIKIVPTKDVARLKSVLFSLDSYEWLIFTSANGVALFFQMMDRYKVSRSVFKTKKFAAIGKKTGDTLTKNGISVALMPQDFIQEALAKVIIKGVANKKSKALLVHAAGSRPVLERELKKSGILLDMLDLYKAEPLTSNHGRIKKLFVARKVDAVMLTSSSCVDSFVNVFGKDERKRLTKDVVIAAIGPVTASSVREAGLPVTVESREYTMEGVANALTDYYVSTKRATS
ncbi:MAG: uroporphyrinogen-III C-methyltransferase [Candidatus Omnitrophica bacterium]|nr:uroporphyrinogen-III C-methyltransferase [Candidatus Omnitrophota bacterium]